MTQKVSPIIKAKELLSFKNASNITLIDARAGANAQEQYEKGHLEGALFVDLNTQLASIKSDPSLGGRHPLPNPAQFAQVLTQLGITPERHVIIYDDKNGSNA